jgi:hypothetical protein
MKRDQRLSSLIAGAVLIALITFTAGFVVGRRTPRSVGVPGGDPGTEVSVEQAGDVATAPDISAMSPEERASRLFDRVMRYKEQGKVDSARFFAPMAISAYELVGPPDAHARYDIGEILVAAGDAVGARARADTILAAQPRHLLGLVLAIRASDLAKDTIVSAGFARRLLATSAGERAAGPKEYTEHARDIDVELTRAAERGLRARD